MNPVKISAELIYVHDPLCGWCYGMSPVINRLQADLAGRLDVSVLCGGMAVGERAAPIAEGWAYIPAALPDVERATGVTFGPAFRALAAAGRYFYDSEPPSRAIVAFRQLSPAPARTVAFAHAVQQALFRDGHDLNDPATYDNLVAPLGVEPRALRQAMAAPDTARATQQEFAAVARIGVQGFPTTVLRVGEQGYVLTRGYQPYEQLRSGIEQLVDVGGLGA